MATESEITKLYLRSSDDLCELAELLGYKDTGRFAINQLQCKNGAFASSLLAFFDDNPDAMEVVKDWVLNYLAEDDDELDEDEGDFDSEDDDED